MAFSRAHDRDEKIALFLISYHPYLYGREKLQNYFQYSGNRHFMMNLLNSRVSLDGQTPLNDGG